MHPSSAAALSFVAVSEATMVSNCAAFEYVPVTVNEFMAACIFNSLLVPVDYGLAFGKLLKMQQKVNWMCDPAGH